MRLQQKKLLKETMCYDRLDFRGRIVDLYSEQRLVIETNAMAAQVTGRSEILTVLSPTGNRANARFLRSCFSQQYGNWSFGTFVFTVCVIVSSLKVSND